MFKANRVGTPSIHTEDFTNHTGAWTINTNSNALLTVTGNVINGTPGSNYVYQNTTYQGTPKGIVTLNKWALLLQYAIQQPVKPANTEGIEINFGLDILCSNELTAVPIFGRLGSAGASTLASVALQGGATRLRGGYNPANGTAKVQWNTYTFRDHISLTNFTDLTGIYAHGFLFYNGTGATLDISGLHASASMRIFSDQRVARYKDPHSR